MEALKFSLMVNTVPVTIEGATGTPEEYTLREMDAANRDKYLDTVADRVRVDTAGKVVGIKKFEGMQADLLLHTLRKKDGSMVRKEVIQGWPATVVSGLFKAAQKLNLLDEKEKGEATDESKKD